MDKDSKTITGTTTYLCSEAPSRAQQIVQVDDVLVATVRPNLNGVAYVTDKFNGATASTGYCVLRPNKSLLDPRYLFHWVKTKDFIEDMVKKATGANYPAVSDAIVKISEIPLPPLPIQQRIAAVLDEVDALRQKREQSLEILEKLIDSIFTKQVGDPITGQYQFHTKPGRHIYKLASGKFFKREEHSGTGEVPAFGGSGLTGWADFANFTGETVIIGRVGFHCGNVSLIKAPTFITDNAIYTKEISDDINVDFLYHFLRLAKLNRFRDPGDLKKITQKPLDELLIPVPPLAIQEAIVKEIQGIEALIAQAQASREHITRLLASLQTQAFSGELSFRALELR
ncbi:restriction endonuclease subunit S [Deinococcus sp. PEB2-67]